MASAEELNPIGEGLQRVADGIARNEQRLNELSKRDAERERAKQIGEGTPAPMPEMMTLPEMLKRLVHISDGAMVALRGSPHTVLKFADFKQHTRAGQTMVGKRAVFTADLWQESRERITVHTMTFRPGAPEFTSDPNGTLALNLWVPRVRIASIASVEPFLDHMAYLVPIEAERERFLSWLAHNEQLPGVLPHTHYLMVTPMTGIGRNWLSSLLARVWPGECRLGFDLLGTLKSGFNGPLSRRTLVVVDELKAEAGYMGAATGQQLKALLTTEERTINPKFGRVYHEHNCARWLMFSQHDDALPLEQYDRRVIVIDNPTERRPPEYYNNLYGLLDDAGFVAAVAQWLGRRDLRGFNPSEPAPLTASKQRAIDAGLSDVERCLMHLCAAATCDLMTSAQVAEHIRDNGLVAPIGRGLQGAYKRAGIKPCTSMPRINGKQQRVVALRNGERYETLPASELAAVIRDQGA